MRKVLKLILPLLAVVFLGSCLSSTNTQQGPELPPDKEETDKDYFELNINGQAWKFHKTRVTIKANADEGMPDYTVSLIAIDASNSITTDSKQVRIYFNAADLESLEGTNIALGDEFHITYRGLKETAAAKYTYKSGVMNISQESEKELKLSFGNLTTECRGSLIDPEEVTATLTISGTIMCQIAK